MSLIPKIGIGTDLRKNKFHVPAITHGTSEIGYVTPSYSRNLINNASVNLSTRTVVRLSPLFVPTMGDLSVRHYHCFVPFNKMWTPFDAFMDKKPFAFPDGFSQIPTEVPHFCVGQVLRHLMQLNLGLWDQTPEFNTLRTDMVGRIYYQDTNTVSGWKELDHAACATIFGSQPDQMTWGNDNFNNLWNNNNLHITNSDLNVAYGGLPSLLYIDYGQGHVPGNYYGIIAETYENSLRYRTVRPFSLISDTYKKEEWQKYVVQLSVPTMDACDFSVCYQTSHYKFLVCYNFNGAWKRLRSIFLGLGYCFNPYDDQYVTPFKLMAFYRCYWSKFGVNRNYNFQDTECAKLTREISRLASGVIDAVGALNTTLQKFIMNELTKCTYTTPSDYFNSSVTNTQQALLDSGGSVSLNSMYGSITNASSESQLAYQVGATARAGSSQSQNSPANPTISGSSGEQVATALGIQMAMRLMRWINRRTVVGSAIYDGLRSLYGNIDINDESSEGVVRIGEDTTDIQIGAIFNQSDFINQDSGAPLGSFAGVGTGRSNKPKRYKFTAPSFGCVITLTAVVPQMGYFQGMLRENSDGVKDNFEMFDPTYDALGWQSVRYNEIVSDRQFMMDTSNVQGYVGTNLGIFGAQPRYTHMKCGFNRCLGDISLPHMQDSMLTYTLDRFFHQRKPLPANVPQTFRSATQGDTNRIFQVVSPTDDHVIWQIYFDVDMFASMKSISDSYDTHLPDDSGEMQVSHE